MLEELTDQETAELAELQASHKSGVEMRGRDLLRMADLEEQVYQLEQQVKLAEKIAADANEAVKEAEDGEGKDTRQQRDREARADRFRASMEHWEKQPVNLTGEQIIGHYFEDIAPVEQAQRDVAKAQRLEAQKTRDAAQRESDANSYDAQMRALRVKSMTPDAALTSAQMTELAMWQSEQKRQSQAG